MADVSILIPWRSDGAQRQRIFDRLLPIWQETGLDVQVGVDDPAGPFNINRALNRARTQATGEVLVVMGADHIPDPGHIRSAAGRLLDSGKAWLSLFSSRAVLTRQATRQILGGGDPYVEWPVLTRSAEAPGIVAVRSDVWDELGGRDERFAGWGGEDRAYLMALTTLHGPGGRCRQVVRDLWHEPLRRRTSGNHTLLKQYRAADGRPSRMRAVLEGSRA